MRVAPVLIASIVACSTSHRADPVKRAPVAQAPAVIAPGLRLPDGVTPISYDLELDVDPDSETFRGKVRIRARLAKPTNHVWLHAVDLEIKSARWDDGALALLPTLGDQMRAFGFGRRVEPRDVTIALEFTGMTTHDQQGLFRQRAAGSWYVFSQGEAVYARRITPCFDEPRFKTPWRVTLVVPKPHVALANMPEQRTVVLADRKQITFVETPAMPSYLLAIAVGPFDLVDAGTVGKANVPVRVAVRAGAGKKVGVVAAKLPGVVAAIEAYTDDALPWPKLDLVAVPQLFGAMENPGLITFDEPMLVGDEREKGFAGYFTQIAAHEIAHQWFGNLVTPAWWDDLWLSEALASWLGDKITAELRGFDDVPLRRALARRSALEADAAHDALPLRRDINDNEAPDEGFDAIAYAKGQAVLAMFEAFIGEDTFRWALRGYLKSHRAGNVTANDLVTVLVTATTTLVGDAFTQYVTRTGPPVVELALRCTGKTAVVTATARDTRLVPVCLSYAGARAAVRTCAVVADRNELALTEATGCPRWVRGNADGGYYHVAWTTHGPRGPAPKLADLDPAARIITGDDLAAALVRGELVAKDAINELRVLADAREPYAQLGAVALASVVDDVIDDATRPAWTTWLAARFSERLTQAVRTPGAADREVNDAMSRLLPPDRFSVARQRRAHVWLEKLIPPASSELPAALVALAAPIGGDQLFDRIADRARTITSSELRDEWLAALGEFGPAQVGRAIDLVMKPELPAGSSWLAVAAYFARPATRTPTWQALRGKLPAIIARMPTDQASDVIDAIASLCDQTSRDEIVTAFEPLIPNIPDGRDHLDDALASIDRCIVRRARVGDLAAALAASR